MIASLDLCFESITQNIGGNKEDLQPHKVSIGLKPVARPFKWKFILNTFYVDQNLYSVGMCNSNSDQNSVGRKKLALFCLTIHTRLNEYVGKWIWIIEKIKVLCNQQGLHQFHDMIRCNNIKIIWFLKEGYCRDKFENIKCARTMLQW